MRIGTSLYKGAVEMHELWHESNNRLGSNPPISLAQRANPLRRLLGGLLLEEVFDRRLRPHGVNCRNASCVAFLGQLGPKRAVHIVPPCEVLQTLARDILHEIAVPRGQVNKDPTIHGHRVWYPGGLAQASTSNIHTFAKTGVCELHAIHGDSYTDKSTSNQQHKKVANERSRAFRYCVPCTQFSHVYAHAWISET
jgi:hypothetical protein